MYLSPEQSIGIVGIRSLDCYNIRPEVMHFYLTGLHNLFSKWDMDLQFEEYLPSSPLKMFATKEKVLKRKVLTLTHG